MNPRLVTVGENLRVDDWLFAHALEGLGAADHDARLADRANSLRWIAGHLTGARFLMARLVGHDAEYQHAEIFQRGADHGTAAALPELAEIVADYERISVVLREGLDRLDDAALDRDSGQKFPSGDNTILGGLSFLCLHESYHLGQMALIRVALGHPPVVG